MRRAAPRHMLLLPLVLACLAPAARAQASPLNRSVRTAADREPAIPRPDQDARAEAALEAFVQRHGRRPNLLLLVIDDMGYGDPGCYGGGAAVGAATPNLDRLARGGLRLTSCYAQHTCTPTRSAILTGRLPLRTGLTRPILAGDRLARNPWEGEVSLARLLGRAGYRTLLTGKWHIGEVEGMRPHEVGFDEFFGYYGAQKEISQSVDGRRYPDLVNDPEKLAAYGELGMGHSLVHAHATGELREVSSVRSTEDMGRADAVLAAFTRQKLREFAAADQPWFVEHCFMKAHCDNFPNPDLPSFSASKYAYKEAVGEVDHHVGEILRVLEETGQLASTFVFLTSDNGPQMDGWPDAGYTPFRGAKGTTFEGGVRVPGIASWPGMIAAGRESDDLFDLMDLYLTCAHLGGARLDLPEGQYVDSVDQTSFLLDERGAGLRECVWFWWQSELMAVRLREYKEHFKVVLPATTHMHIDMATVQDVGLAPWLFNLYLSPKEELTVGHRRNAWLASLASEAKAHAATFQRFPPKDVGLGQ